MTERDPLFLDSHLFPSFFPLLLPVFHEGCFFGVLFVEPGYIRVEQVEADARNQRKEDKEDDDLDELHDLIKTACRPSNMAYGE